MCCMSEITYIVVTINFYFYLFISTKNDHVWSVKIKKKRKVERKVERKEELSRV